MSINSRGRVLFADDDQMVLRATSNALALSGFEVTSVENASQALAALQTTSPEALLLDINMPGNTDLELVQTLGKEWPWLPVVLLTGYPTLATALGAVRLGVVDYITKPHSVEQLLERLDLAIHRARVLRSLDELSLRLEELKSVLSRGPGAIYFGASAEDGPAPLRNLTPGELERLSPREREVLSELARGHSPQKIAEALDLSTNTIRNHLKNIFIKLAVKSQVALLAKLASPPR